jgi:hypothetical protein
MAAQLRPHHTSSPEGREYQRNPRKKKGKRKGNRDVREEESQSRLSSGIP